VTTLRTPGGNPASRASSPSASAVSGVWTRGLEDDGVPAASAGATFQTASSNGKFHGTIAATTPTGSRTV
jgi:hypothetical protein